VDATTIAGTVTLPNLLLSRTIAVADIFAADSLSNPLLGNTTTGELLL
jgi:hypothetical protein